MGKEYEISHAGDACAACGKQMQPGEELVATVQPGGETDGQEVFVRRDFCAPCWSADGEKLAGPDSLGTWRTRVPRAKEKKKLFVDDEVLAGFFQRLEGVEDPSRQQFRFVLALVLMRKRMLVYDRSEATDAGDVWTLHFRGRDGAWRVVDPKMDEDKIAEVSRQLGEILQGEL
jgi:hypothetical protein